MIIDIYQIDAFTDELFKGNPAAVCPLSDWLSDDILLNIAKENNLAETAFFIHKQANVFHLRWFTPEIEIDLCGHATLASAYVIFKLLKYNFNTIIFSTLSGNLKVKVVGDQFELVLPSRPPFPAELPEVIKRSLSAKPKEVFKARDYMLVYDSEEDILDLKVSGAILEQINLDAGGIIVTSKGDNSDFVSRFFTPGAAVFEDPVTGSAHCTLVPYWAERLKKTELFARQVSERGGALWCRLTNNRVFIRGDAVHYLKGEIEIK